MRHKVEEVHQYRQAMEEIKQNCIMQAQLISDTIDQRSTEVLALYKADEGSSEALGRASHIIGKVYTGALKAIPGFGGFFDMLCDVAADPMANIYGLIDQTNAAQWDFMANPSATVKAFAHSDVVAKALEHTAHSRLGQYINDSKLRFQQYENDMRDLLGNKLITHTKKYASGPTLHKQHISPYSPTTINHNRLEFAKMRAAIRSGTLKNLATTSKENWTWHCLSLLARSMYHDTDGRKDIHRGVFCKKNKQGEPILMRGKEQISSI